MSKPMTPTQIKSQLSKWGVSFREYKDWQTHNRGDRGNGWDNLNGVMWHHTGSDSTDQRALLYNGYQGLPGPLCHFGIAQDGTVWLIGWGRANHAGSGDDDVLRAVIAESYGNNPPTDNETNTDGNGRFYGMEIWYSGSHGMTGAQYMAALRVSVAICDFHNWSEKSAIGHGEWQPGKWDPGYAPGKMMDMHAVRNDIRQMLDDGPGTKPVTKPDTTPEPTVKPEPVSDLYKQIMRTDAVPVDYMGNPDNPYYWMENVIRDIHKRVINIEKKMGA